MTEDKLNKATELKRKINTAKEIQNQLWQSVSRAGGKATVSIESDVNRKETYYLEEVYVKAITGVLKELESIWQLEFSNL